MKLSISVLLKIMICVFLFSSLSGCWDSAEMDTLAIVMGIGIDKAAQQDGIHLTTQVVNPGQIGTASNKSGNIVDKNAYWNVLGTGITIPDALSGIVHQLSRKLFFPHAKVIIFSEELARDGIGEYIDYFVRHNEIRMNSLLLISKCSANELMDMESELESIPAMAITSIEKIHEMTSKTSVMRMYEFALKLMSETTAPIAVYIDIIESNGKKIFSVTGMAVFRKDRMTGFLTQDEVHGLLWIIGGGEENISLPVFPDGKNKTIISTFNTSGKVNCNIKNGMPDFEIVIKCDVVIENSPANVDVTLPETLKTIEKATEDEIKDKILAVINKARQLNTDIFGFGEAIHKKYPNEWKKMKDRWDEIFQQAEVETYVKANLRETGTIINNLLKKQE